MDAYALGTQRCDDPKTEALLVPSRAGSIIDMESPQARYVLEQRGFHHPSSIWKPASFATTLRKREIDTGFSSSSYRKNYDIPQKRRNVHGAAFFFKASCTWRIRSCSECELSTSADHPRVLDHLQSSPHHALQWNSTSTTTAQDESFSNFTFTRLRVSVVILDPERAFLTLS